VILPKIKMNIFALVHLSPTELGEICIRTKALERLTDHELVLKEYIKVRVATTKKERNEEEKEANKVS
jgi:hypothetical protein